MQKKKSEIQFKKKLWSFSTTIRSPYRIRDFLKTLHTIEGKEWNHSTQEEFQIRLIQDRFYGLSPQFSNGLSENHRKVFLDQSKELSFDSAKKIFESKKYMDPPIRGRTSFSPLKKLGITVIRDGKIVITPLGKYMLSDNYNIEEFFFKSLLKWQYPNPLSPTDFSKGDIYNIKPFIATMHLINEVNKICIIKNIKQKGVSRLEFEIFALSLVHYSTIMTHAEALIKFRIKIEGIKNTKQKKDIIQKYKDDFLKEYVNVNNTKDYSDNAIRYFRLTRYFFVRGGGFYIDLEPRRNIEIQKLLESDNGSAQPFSETEYIDLLSNINMPELPWETSAELKKIYKKIIKEINEIKGKTKRTITDYKIPKDKNNLLKQISKARKDRQFLQNILAKEKLSNIQEIERVKNDLYNIRNLMVKPSIALEKLITETLNIINDAVNIAPNYPVGDDNEPTFTAPANVPDIECFYSNFNSICEVTMLTGRDQWYNEGQPVMRHLRDFEDKHNQDSYCLFIAPKMHRDTINTFWLSVKYEYEGKSQKIIPLTIKQIVEILDLIIDIRNKGGDVSHHQFRNLLDEIIKQKDIEEDSVAWQGSISKVLKNWKSGLVAK